MKSLINKTIEINNREYTVGYEKETVNGAICLGVEGKRGAIYSVYLLANGTFSKLVKV